MNILQGIEKGIKFQPSIIKNHMAGNYSYVGSLPDNMCRDLNTSYPRPMIFKTFDEAKKHAIKCGFPNIK